MNFSSLTNLMIPEGSVTALRVEGILLWSKKPSDTKLIVNSDLYTAYNGEYITESDTPRFAIYTHRLGLTDQIYCTFGTLTEGSGGRAFTSSDMIKLSTGVTYEIITVGVGKLSNASFSLTDRETGETLAVEEKVSFSLQKGHTYELRVTEK